MAYTTISGAISTDTEWTAGTYFLINDVPIGTNTLTLNSSAGDVVVKTSGVYSLQLDTISGVLIASGVNNVIFTSMNDDAHGDPIAGSTGVPTTGDQSAGYIEVSEDYTTINLTNTELWYCSCQDSAVIDYGFTSIPLKVGNNLFFDYVTLKHCSMPDGASNDSTYIGQWRRKGMNTVSMNHISIDSTNTVAQTGTKGSVFKFNGCSSFTLQNSYIAPTANANGYVLGNVKLGLTSGTSTVTISNNLLVSDFNYGILNLLSDQATATLDVTVKNCVLDGIDGSHIGILVYQSAGTYNFTMRDTILTNCVLGLDQAGTIALWDEDYNIFWNNGVNSDQALGSNSKIFNPHFSTLPLPATIAGTFPIPDGYAITSIAALEKAGSDTFNNLGIDETQFSTTGYKYLGTDLVTPGVNYQLTQFYYPPRRGTVIKKKPKSLYKRYLREGIRGTII